MRTPSLVLVTWLFTVAGALGGSGCYNPDLGDNPFRCSEVDPDDPGLYECPDGYECVEKICVRKNRNAKPDAGSDGPPSMPDPMNCPDKRNEPNDSESTATQWGFSPAINLAICGVAQDRADYYKISLKERNTMLITVGFSTKAGPKLDLIAFKTGAESSDPKKSGTLQVGNEEVGRVLMFEAPKPPMGKTEDWYYFKVFPVGGGMNFYTLDVAKIM